MPRTNALPCSHCALPVPAGLIDPEAPDDRQFCCSGCRIAYEVIHDHGLDRYYDLRERLEVETAPARVSSRAYEEFDDPSFEELYCRPTRDGLLQVDLYLEGVHCAACVWLVEKTPTIVDGAYEVRLDLGRSLASVRWDPDRVSLSRIGRFLDSLGYTPHPFHGVERHEMARREDRSLLIRMGVAGAVAGNVMVIAFALYGGHFHGISPAMERFFRWASMVISMPSVLWCAGVFYRGAWGALRVRRLHMDVPIAIGILAGAAWGAFNTIRGTGEIYFDSVTVLIFLLLVGRFVQRRQQRSAARATELLFSLAPTTVRIVEGDEVREAPLASVLPGAVVEVRAGETIPADGVISSGTSDLDLSLLTGESRPVSVSTGDAVHAGTVNLSGRLTVEVVSAGEDTRLGRLMRLVEEGAKRRAPVILMADRISAWFVAAVLTLAATTAVIWLVLDPSRAVDHAIALLIVSCPCALGLATPLAVSAAIGRAARAGILIKGGDALECLGGVGRIILDKTGTLTEGRQEVIDWIGDESVKPLVAAVEAGSSHTIARALAEYLGPSDMAVQSFQQHQGRGVSGEVAGHEVMVGSPGFVSSAAEASGSELSDAVQTLVADGHTPVLIAVDGEVKAACGLGDPIRPEAEGTISEISAAGWQVRVLSGDHPEVVAWVVRELGLPADAGRGGADPEAKVAAVQAAGAESAAVMVGDGVNDAAALAAATVGVGVHGGAEATLAAADVYLARPGLGPLVELLEGSRRTLRVIRRNLVLSLGYNIVAVSMAMMGLMHPLVAAVLMPLSSVTVVLSSYRARTFDAPGDGDS